MDQLRITEIVFVFRPGEPRAPRFADNFSPENKVRSRNGVDQSIDARRGAVILILSAFATDSAQIGEPYASTSRQVLSEQQTVTFRHQSHNCQRTELLTCRERELSNFVDRDTWILQILHEECSLVC